MTIYIDKNQENTLIFTLNESTTVSDVMYILEVHSKATDSSKIMWLLNDLTINPERYNKFIITEVPLEDEDLLDMKINLIEGGHSFFVWQTGSGELDLASATNLTLGTDGNVFELTGTTKVDLISNVSYQEGAMITLIANESVVIDHGTATSGTNITIMLAGAADYSMTADDTLTLVLSSTTAGGQAWREIARTAI